MLEERGIELEYLIDEGDYRIVSAAEYSAGEDWLMHADLAEKGYADIVLKTKSAGGHSSNPYGGTSLEVLSRAITAICDIEWPTRVTDLLAAQLVELGLYTADEIAGKRVLDVDRRDGVKLLLEGDAWVMMRPSGTEPLVRIYAEAATTDEVNELLDAAEAVVTSL